MAYLIFAFELICLSLLNLFGKTECSDAFILLLIIISAVSIAMQFSSKEYSRIVQDTLTLGLILRIFFLCFDLYAQKIFVLPNSGADSEMFYGNALNVAKGGTTSRGFFPELMGWIFRYIGTSRLWGQYLLVLCSVVALVYAAKTLYLLELDVTTIRKTMLLLSLLPNYAILSSIFLRESLVAMFVSISAYQYIKWTKQKSEWSFILAIVFVFLGMRFHSGTIAVAVGYVLSRFIYNNQTGQLSISVKNIVSGIILLLVGVFFLNRYGDSFLGTFGTVDSVEDIAKKTVDAGSSYAAYVGNSDSIPNFILYSIPRMLFFQFSPMPWMIRGISDIIAFCFSSCFYIVTLVRALKYLSRHDSQYRVLVTVMIIVVACAAFVFGWGVTNSGTACRHRDKMVMIWGILYALSEAPMEKENLVTK